ncbi:hypothetical protein PC9H_008794 [Pleurotus ostreatus]|uniref:GroES-like protein n=2 Tax=Pleurotus TaxID=5320 RepID=A0A8H6ZTB4_PLEOS|nr:uncharacterized protein PC9H_008794 [Pleurotus ostreatus]KAF7426426.1 hypothetical protein PC9H_008794 [Pleurotus ostreatus]
MASLPNLPETFKAVRCSKPNNPWEIVEVPLRAPKGNEVLIRVHASGVCNSEHFVKEGTWPGLQYPRTPGHEVIGRVAAVGSGILAAHGGTARFQLGALVGAGWNGGYCNRCDVCRKGDYWTCPNGDFTGFTVDGGHAEYMYAPETMVIGIEEEALQKASYAELAPLFCAGATVFDAIRTTKWSPGDVCVVQGIGGLGHLAVQFAAKMGLKVYAVSSGPSKKDLAMSLGAHEHIDSSSTDVVKYVQSLGGAQIIVCTAPYAKLISDIIPAVAKNGTVTLVSAATDKPIEVWNLTMNMNRATIRGWCCGCAQDMEECVKFATQTDIKTMVQEYTLDQFAHAYDATMQNKARFRNVIVFK